MVHIIRSTCDAGIVSSALPDKLKEVIDAGEDVIHEDDSVEVLVF
jgi:hypothetical protein